MFIIQSTSPGLPLCVKRNRLREITTSQSLTVRYYQFKSFVSEMVPASMVSVARDLSRSRDGLSVGQFSLGIPGLFDLGLISATSYHSKNFQGPR